MDDEYDVPDINDAEEDTPTGINNEEQIPEKIQDLPKAEPTEAAAEPQQPDNTETAKAVIETCPYCGQPLEQRLINGKIWYLHPVTSECRAIFQGISALKEARDTKLLLEEEQQKEKEEKLREETARKTKEAVEKPFREAAQKTAEFAVQILEKQLNEIQEKYVSQQNEIQEKYTELLEKQQKTITQAQDRLEALLNPHATVTIPDRSLISNAIESYKTKLNQCAADDPNSQTYEYLEKSFNDLLSARDDAEVLINTTTKNAQAIQTRLEAAIKDIQEKMENVASDGKEYNSIQRKIMESGQGTILALEEQLQNLERLFFRKA